MSNPPSGLRAPLPEGGLQVNFCRNAMCANFGVPVDPRFPAGNPDDRYRILKGGKLLPDRAMKCLECGTSFNLKSNAGLSAELERLSAYLQPAQEPRCETPNCANATKGVFTDAEAYVIREHRGKSIRLQCRACKARFSVARRSTIKQKLPHVNRTVFAELVTKKPIRGIAEVIGVDEHTVYDKIDFIHRQCVGFAGERERRLSSMSRESISLCVDSQDYMINWRARTKRRNVQLTAICTVDAFSGYVFAHSLNFDPSADQTEIEDAARLNGDLAPGAKTYFRAHPQYWLRSEFDKRSLESKEEIRTDFEGEPMFIDDLIRAVREMEDALPEEEMRDAPARGNQMPHNGVLTHSDYTAYAHALLVSRFLSRTERVKIYTDQSTMLRNAFAAAFAPWIAEGRGEMAFVQFQKAMTVDEKRNLKAHSQSQLNKLCKRFGISEAEAIRRAMGLGYMDACRKISDPDARWIRHPKDTMNEPRRHILYLTDNRRKSLDKIGRILSRATLAPVDTYFMRLRRKVNYFERGVPTKSNASRLWSGYHAYDPKRVLQLLEIFRVYSNFVYRSGKKATAAEVIGLARGPAKFEDILYWMPRRP